MEDSRIICPLMRNEKISEGLCMEIQSAAEGLVKKSMIPEVNFTQANIDLCMKCPNGSFASDNE